MENWGVVCVERERVCVVDRACLYVVLARSLSLSLSVCAFACVCLRARMCVYVMCDAAETAQHTHTHNPSDTIPHNPTQPHTTPPLPHTHTHLIDNVGSARDRVRDHAADGARDSVVREPRDQRTQWREQRERNVVALSQSALSCTSAHCKRVGGALEECSKSVGREEEGE